MQLGYNRLRVREDGRARAVFDNLERIPDGPAHHEFALLWWRTRRSRRSHCRFITRRTPSCSADELE